MWPDTAGAHLDDEVAGVGGDPQHRERDADLVVEGADGCDRRARGGEHRCRGGPWCSVLPVRAGDADDGEVQRPVDHLAGEPAEGVAGVLDDDSRPAPGPAASSRAATAPASAAAPTKSWPSTRLADSGHEQPARSGLARVGDDRAVDEHRAGLVLGNADEPAAGDDRDVAEGHRDHRGTASAARRRAARSSSRSSKGWTTPATSWPVSWPLPTTATVASDPSGQAAATASRIACRRSPTS